MEIITCPNCSASVIPMQNRTCPSCQIQLDTNLATQVTVMPEVKTTGWENLEKGIIGGVLALIVVLMSISMVKPAFIPIGVALILIVVGSVCGYFVSRTIRLKQEVAAYTQAMKTQSPEALYAQARRFARQNDTVMAIALLRQAIRGEMSYLQTAKTERDFDSIRLSAEFQALVRSREIHDE